MIYRSRISKINISPRKVLAVVRSIKKLPLEGALILLDHWPKKASRFVKGAITQAVNNAGNRGNLKMEDLKIKEIRVLAGPSLKRTWPRSRGQADLIKRRSAKIEVAVEGGKN